ncbi:hypothetical protein ACHQM5_015110 [Ranunculus cassubicifolius]
MASQERGRPGPLPKFGDWDVNNPASAEGFTVIFNKARDEKKTNTNVVSPRKNNDNYQQRNEEVPSRTKRKWFCCG